MEIDLYVRDDFSLLPELLRDERDVFLVYDRNVSWAAESIRGLCALKGAMAVDASEAAKNLDTVTGICRFLLEAGADRIVAGSAVLEGDIRANTAALLEVMKEFS